MKTRLKRLNRDGIPIDGRDWTEADWIDLHNAIESIKARIAARHRQAPAGDDVGVSRAERLPDSSG